MHLLFNFYLNLFFKLEVSTTSNTLLLRRYRGSSDSFCRPSSRRTRRSAWRARSSCTLSSSASTANSKPAKSSATDDTSFYTYDWQNPSLWLMVFGRRAFCRIRVLTTVNRMISISLFALQRVLFLRFAWKVLSFCLGSEWQQWSPPMRNLLLEAG
jgi:hypothetical protein